MTLPALQKPHRAPRRRPLHCTDRHASIIYFSGPPAKATMSSKVREVEHTAASQCEYVTTTSYVSKSVEGEGWHEPADPPTDAAEAALATTPTVRLDEGTTLRVAPMDRKCGGWDYEHFHDKLRLADGCNAGRGMVVTLEGESGARMIHNMCWFDYCYFGRRPDE